ncbi:MAG: glycosyltransferase family 2 protein [Candidatus Levybacteria bacterium]|nr:glycosyltransferase family 2 protein [Candidatus Levybacteria bacterium]
MNVVIIPATYNEKGNIERLIEILEEEVFPKIKTHQTSILVADDNSPDGTGDVVKNLMKRYKNLHINQGEKKGLGAAYIRAMTHAIEKMGADVVFEIDADLSHDPREIPHFLKKIDEGYDIVIGTRYSSGGSMPKNWPMIRKMFSVTANLIVRLITGRVHIHDWTGGYRGIKKQVFLKEREKTKMYQGYTFQVAFLYKSVMDGYKVGEVPIHFADRELGRSKIAPIEYIINLLKYVIIERIKELKRFVKFLVVGGTGFIVQILAQEISVRTGFTFFLAQISSIIISKYTMHSDLASLTQAYGAAIGAETAILSNFFFNNTWTFKDRASQKNNGNVFIRLIKFNFTSFASIIIQFFAVWIGVKILGVDTAIWSVSIPTRILIVIPTIVLIIIPLNYLIYNKIIWKRQHEQDEKTLKS